MSTKKKFVEEISNNISYCDIVLACKMRLYETVNIKIIYI